MHVQIIQDDLLEQRLEVESRLVPVDVRVAAQGQNSADVGVLELDRSFRSASEQSTQPLIVLRLVDAKARELVAKHREIVADGGLDLLARPIVAGQASAPHVVQEL
jgi:hypothetical protein